MNGWSLLYEGYNPDQEGLREALCTLGNGYFATRGAHEESQADSIHYPGTYLAGGYNRLKSKVKDRVIENEDLVNMPNWLYLTFRINGGQWFKIDDVEVQHYRRELDLKKGLLLREIQFKDDKGRITSLKSKRLVHMGNPHLAALQTEITAENWSGSLEFKSALDGTVVNDGVERYRGLNNKHLEPLETDFFEKNCLYLKVQTNQSEIRIAEAAKHQVYKNGERIDVEYKKSEKPGFIGAQFHVDVKPKDTVAVNKIISLFTSRDNAISECGLAARKQIKNAENFEDICSSHSIEWKHLWNRFDVLFRSVDKAENNKMEITVRLYIFHLLQTISPHSMDLDIGAPPRGWHGEAYRGHIFWDELIIFPLLNFRMPEITRSLLIYRYRRLDEARLNASKAGYKGAMYPWQSGSSGREESQTVHLNPLSGQWIPDNSNLQRHVNSAIAYNVFMYYQVTEDTEFLSSHGAEMIWEIARFWSSLTQYNKEEDRYEIRGVMGPDEFHDAYPNAQKPGLNNNAYTNVFAVWVMLQAIKMFDLLPEERIGELRESIRLEDEEIERWKDITHKMKICFHEDGIISQFEGYEKLQEFDWEGYRKKYENIQRLDRILEAEGDSPNNYKLSKQADVLMLFQLFSSDELSSLFKRLGYSFEHQTIPQNIQYYLQRTSHGSTLSWVVHSWVLSRSDREGSWNLFKQALKSDIADIQGGTTKEGIHLGAMAGTVNILQNSYTGIQTCENVLWLNPCLPDNLEYLEMVIRYRGHSLKLLFKRDSFKIRALRAAEKPIKIGFKNQVYEMESGTSKEFEL
ncbi:glycoside hydrolase family 65 protein [bacterium]|nr:glycoside hydrolase family 65 protein [bacterium]